MRACSYLVLGTEALHFTDGEGVVVSQYAVDLLVLRESLFVSEHHVEHLPGVSSRPQDDAQRIFLSRLEFVHDESRSHPNHGDDQGPRQQRTETTAGHINYKARDTNN